MVEIGVFLDFYHSFLGLNKKIVRNLVRNSGNPRFFRNFAPKETKIWFFMCK